MQLNQCSALITGGSRGLGLALARDLASRGGRVVIVSRDAPTLDAIATQCQSAGQRVHALPADVGSAEDATRVIGLASALVGDLDLIVHNASTLGPVPLRPLAETTDRDFERAVQVNLLGPFRLTKAAVGGMVARGTGTVVSISSDAAVEAYPSWGAYGVTKAALDHLSRIWAAELAGTGVRFVAVDPGEMDTAMHHAALPEADRSALPAPAAVAQRVLSLVTTDEGTTGERLLATRSAGGEQ